MPETGAGEPAGRYPAESPADADRAAKDQVRRYYAAATEDYLRYYQTGWHHHMHYGFDRDLPPGGNPTENMVLYLAGLACLRSGDRILDAGCGVGGSSIFLAREMGCFCAGITLVEQQARLANGFAVAAASAPAPGSGAARFVVNDFHTPPFKDGSFDVVWAVESFDHALDKRAWVAAMFHLLKPGGRLLIADGFRARESEDPAAAKEYARFLAGWAVPHLCSAAELEEYARAAGFSPMHSEDISDDVIPHARAIFRFGLLFIPLRWVLAKMGLSNAEKLGNAYATYFQYRTLTRGLWAYRAHCFLKQA
jgi:tocopherol O-methyltransferase